MNHYRQILIGLTAITVLLVAASQFINSSLSLKVSQQAAMSSIGATGQASPSLQSLQQQVAHLQQTLNEERQWRSVLQADLHEIKRILGKINLGNEKGRVSETTVVSTGNPDEENVEAIETERLMVINLPQERWAYFKEIRDQYGLAVANLRIQAHQQGWSDSERYHEELSALYQRLSPKAQLSEQDYDRYLYVRQGSNRIQVARILNQSPAYDAGIQENDLLYRYNGVRLYNKADLYEQLARVSEQSVVLLEVKRKGQLLQYDVPSGALGVQLASALEIPE